MHICACTYFSNHVILGANWEIMNDIAIGTEFNLHDYNYAL